LIWKIDLGPIDRCFPKPVLAQTMRIVTAILTVIATPASSNEWARQEATVAWLNEQLAKSSSVAKLVDQRCEGRQYLREGLTICTYKYSQGSYMEISADADGIIGVSQLIMMAGDDFDRIERESMYIFSLIIWSTMPDSSAHAEANVILRDLYKKSLESLPAQVASGDWTFGIGELSICPIQVLAFVAQRDRSGGDSTAAIENLAKRECSVLP
jgi:hypothetical protein